MLPKDFAPWESVYYYFRKWKRDGLIEETHDVLVERIRTGIGKKPTPSVGIVDSQSVKACNLCEGDVGFDGGYMGELIEWGRIQFQWTLEIVKRTEEHTFKVLPKRWIVERTFAWISFHRRLSKDYERLPGSGMAFIHDSVNG